MVAQHGSFWAPSGSPLRIDELGEKMKTIIIATKNQGKAREYEDLFVPDGLMVKTLNDFPPFPIDENGSSFEENAFIKAQATVDRLHLPVLADDSGLCVDALNGAPGIHSARYAGDHDFVANNAKLLREMRDVPDEQRTAHFHTTIVCLKPSGAKLVVNGDLPGHILHELQGQNGFGYDPLFYVDELQRSMGMLSEEEKNEVSHRARAVNNLKRHFSEWWNAD